MINYKCTNPEKGYTIRHNKLCAHLSYCFISEYLISILPLPLIVCITISNLFHPSNFNGDYMVGEEKSRGKAIPLLNQEQCDQQYTKVYPFVSIEVFAFL